MQKGARKEAVSIFDTSCACHLPTSLSIVYIIFVVCHFLGRFFASVFEIHFFIHCLCCFRNLFEQSPPNGWM